MHEFDERGRVANELVWNLLSDRSRRLSCVGGLVSREQNILPLMQTLLCYDDGSCRKRKGKYVSGRVYLSALQSF